MEHFTWNSIILAIVKMASWKAYPKNQTNLLYEKDHYFHDSLP